MKKMIITAALLVYSTASTSAQSVVDEPEKARQPVILTAISAVADRFTDPVSTQFRRLKIQPDGSVCGQVNTKNLQGGYVGFKPFKFIPGRDTVYLENTGC